MSGTSVTFDGLAELKRQLRELPATLTAEASRITESYANAAAFAIRSAYGPRSKSGRLQRGVIMTHFEKGKFSAGAIVKSTAPHANIFERGTKERWYYTKQRGAKHRTGRMPEFDIFVPIAMEKRRQMWEALNAMVERNGFTVTNG